ncbi:MAG: helix-turn-helix domain-containing protein [Methanomicrobiales archaeon]
MDEIVYVDEQLSSRVIMELLDKHPNVKIIQCPPSLYKRTSKKYLDALQELGIEVETVERKGRPPKYKEDDAERVKDLLKRGYSPKDISKNLEIPLKSVYYLKDVKLTPGRKAKYDEKTIKEVKNMFKKGVKAKEISEKLNIPLRTVYYLLRG